ncbi:MAG: PAS domain S-box protein [Clostridia bacterium]|nr:PAS domain S-box protein [Clostridia bacterium]
MGQGKKELYNLLELLPEELMEAARELLEFLLQGGTISPLSALAERATLLEQILDYLPDATLAIDREGKVLIWNRAAEEMTGVKKEEILGKGDYIYAVPFYGKRRPVLVDLVLGDGQEWEEEYEKVERKGNVVAGEGYAPLACGGRGLYFGGSQGLPYSGSSRRRWRRRICTRTA